MGFLLLQKKNIDFVFEQGQLKMGRSRCQKGQHLKRTIGIKSTMGIENQRNFAKRESSPNSPSQVTKLKYTSLLSFRALPKMAVLELLHNNYREDVYCSCFLWNLTQHGRTATPPFCFVELFGLLKISRSVLESLGAAFIFLCGKVCSPWTAAISVYPYTVKLTVNSIPNARANSKRLFGCIWSKSCNSTLAICIKSNAKSTHDPLSTCPWALKSGQVTFSISKKSNPESHMRRNECQEISSKLTCSVQKSFLLRCYDTPCTCFLVCGAYFVCVCFRTLTCVRKATCPIHMRAHVYGCLQQTLHSRKSSSTLLRAVLSSLHLRAQVSMGPKGGILVKLMGFWNQRNGEICWHFTLAAPCHVFVFQLLSHRMPTVYTYTEEVSKERFVVVSRFRCSRTRIYLNSFTFFSRTHGKGMSGCGETNYEPSRRLKRKVCAQVHESTKLETFTHPHYSNQRWLKVGWAHNDMSEGSMEVLAEVASENVRYIHKHKQTQWVMSSKHFSTISSETPLQNQRKAMKPIPGAKRTSFQENANKHGRKPKVQN